MAEKPEPLRIETREDAVYAVYLRKVRYVSPIHTDTIHTNHTPFTDGDASGSQRLNDHLQWETVKELVIQSGSVSRLLQSLVQPSGELDARHFNVFFSTYRSYADAFEVLRLILNMYSDVCDGQPITGQQAHKRVLHATKESLRCVLMNWLEQYPEDFRDQQHGAHVLLCELMEFSKANQPHLVDVYAKAAQLKRAIMKAQSWNQNNGSLQDHENYAYYSPDMYQSVAELHMRATGWAMAASRLFNGLNTADGLQYEALGSAQLLRRLPSEYITQAVVTGNKSDIVLVDAAYFAEQLTFWDARLFVQLVPWQCQACFWSRRHRSPEDKQRVQSVWATVDQFNAITNRVIDSVLYSDPLQCPLDYRAKVIDKWIHIAQEVSSLKNYSSLKAIVSALSSEPVHRLSPVWALVTDHSKLQLTRLTQLVQSQNLLLDNSNDKQQPGTSKSKPSTPERIKVKQKSPGKRYQRAKSDNDVQGMVPYLGPLLTDLTMIEEALPDKDANGFYNFVKRRTEFDVLARIRLYQSIARNYHLVMDPSFPAWFHYLPADFTDDQRYARSYEIYRNAPSHNQTLKKHSTSSLLGLDLQNFDLKRAGLSKSSTWSRLFGNRQHSMSNANYNPINYSDNDEWGIMRDQESDCDGFYPLVPADYEMNKQLNGETDSFNQPLTITMQHHRQRSGRGMNRHSQSVPPQQRSMRGSASSGAIGQSSHLNGNTLRMGNGHCRLKSNEEHTTNNNNNGLGLLPIKHTQPEEQYNCEFDPVKMHKQELYVRSMSRQSGRTCSTPVRATHTINVGGGTLPAKHTHRTNGSIHDLMEDNIDQSDTEFNRTGHNQSQTSFHKGHNKKVSSTSSGQLSIASTSSANQCEHYVLRVAVLDSPGDTHAHVQGAANYKCIRLENGDKLSQVIGRALEKHMLTVDPADYVLIQLMPDGGEFQLPDRCNPYYAVVPPKLDNLNNLNNNNNTNYQNQNSSTSSEPNIQLVPLVLNCVLKRRESLSDENVSNNGGLKHNKSAFSALHNQSSSAVARLLKRNKQKQVNLNSTQPNTRATLSRWSSGHF